MDTSGEKALATRTFGRELSKELRYAEENHIVILSFCQTSLCPGQFAHSSCIAAEQRIESVEQYSRQQWTEHLRLIGSSRGSNLSLALDLRCAAPPSDGD